MRADNDKELAKLRPVYETYQLFKFWFKFEHNIKQAVVHSSLGQGGQ